MQILIITNIDAHFRRISAFLHKYYACFRSRNIDDWLGDGEEEQPTLEVEPEIKADTA